MRPTSPAAASPIGSAYDRPERRPTWSIASAWFRTCVRANQGQSNFVILTAIVHLGMDIDFDSQNEADREHQLHVFRSDARVGAVYLSEARPSRDWVLT